MEKRKRAKGISMVLLLIMVLQLIMPVNFAYGDGVPSEDINLPEGKDIEDTDEDTISPEDEEFPEGKYTDEEETISSEDTDFPEDKDIDEEETVPSEDTDLDDIIGEEGADISDNEVPEDTTYMPENTSDLPKDKLSNAVTPAGIQVAEIGPLRDLGNIFTFESMTVNGKEVSDGDIIEIKDGTIAEISFEWDTKDLNAQAGDTAEVQLSDAFKTMTTPATALIVDGTNVGTYHVDNGLLMFEFNEGIKKDDVHNGWVKLRLEFNLEKFKENIEQEIPFHDGSEHNITVIARPNLDHSGITKEGHPNREKNATEITWTIDVINTNDKPITDAQLRDELPEGLGDADNFVINHLIVGCDGDIREGQAAGITATGFPVELGDIAPYKGYRVTFTTPIEDYEQESFTNEAWFEYDNVSLPAKTTVFGLTRSNPIQKEGSYFYDKENNIDYIDWEIIVNENGQTINNAIVKDDELPAGVKLVQETIKITKNGADVTNKFEVDDFPITLGKVAENEVYRIKFRTKVDWLEVNNGEYQKNNGFLNKATLYDGDDELNDDDATVYISRDPILEKVGVDNVDYDNKTITWTVTVNKAKHPLGDVTVTDVLPKGLSLDPNNITITGDKDGDFSSVVPKLTSQDGTTKLEINLTSIGTETVTITYTTDIKDFTASGFTNKVGIDGDGIGELEPPREVEINPAANTYTKSFAGINYEKKTINWRLNVNPKREAIEKGFVITDTFTNDGLILLPETLDIELGDDKLEAGIDYNLAPIDDHYKNGFTITFNRAIEKAELVVTFTTSYDPNLEIIPHSNINEPGLYRNKALFEGTTENDNHINETRDASQLVREDSWKSGKKEGQLVHFDEDNQINGWISGSERKIAWQFYFNYQQQNLGTGVVVKDTLAYDGEIDKNSVVVSDYTVDKDGNTEIITNKVVDSDNYDLKVDGKELVLTFKDEFQVYERYAVTFTTSVPNKSAGTYTNDAVVTVNGTDYTYEATLQYKEHDDFLDKSAVGIDGNKVFTGDEVNWQVRVNDSLSIIENVVITDTISAGHVYTDGSLEVFKLVGTEEVPLVKDEDYTLKVDKNTETGATDLKIKLIDKLENTLILRYKTVVTKTYGTIGNSISLDGTDFEIKSVESERLTASQFSDAGGEWAAGKGAFEVTKVDAGTGETIENNEASFTLWYKLNGDYVQFGGDGAVFKTVNGVLSIGNLPLRTYYLKEEKAPVGYIKLDDETEIVVDEKYDGNNANIVKLKVKNTKIKTEVTVVKTWVGGPTTHPTVKLTLYRHIEGGAKEAAGESVTLENGITSYTWTDLDKTDMNGSEYIYTVDEENVPNGYVKSIQVNGNIVTITNRFEFKKTDITAEKVWDGGSSLKPTIKLQLFRNGSAYQNSVTLVNGDTKYTWYDLDLYDTFGVPFEYMVREIEIGGSKVEEGQTVNNYKYEGVTVDDDGKFIITNTYVIPTDASAKATKEWVNGSESKPTVWFQLWRHIEDGAEELVPEAEIKELANGITEVEWTGLEETDIAGNKYEFSVKEVDADGNDFTPVNYEKAENGLTVTNNYVSPKDASAKAVKVWDGLPEGREIEKPTVWFELFRYVGTEETEETEAVPGAEFKELADGITEVVWTGLTKTNSDGQEYSFLVKEVDADGNDFVPENYKKSEDGLTVTNTYTKKDVTAEKVWDGGSTPRPTIWFELYRQVEGGELEKVDVAIKELADGVTEVTWEDVDKTDEFGNEYSYSVKEVDADGNDFVPSRYRKSEVGLTVTNTKRPSGGREDPNPVEKKGKIIVNKVDEEKKPLSEAEFTLYDANGKVVAKEVTGPDGTVSFTDLQKGQYVLKETKAPEGYILGDDETDIKISGSGTKSYTVVNRKDEKPTPPTPDEPTKPDEPKPGEPANPDEPTKPNEPETPAKEWEDISDPNAPKETAALPNTGHPLNTWMLGFTGLSMILAGMVLSKRKII
jgi:uncharacterized repeat protein (TIGR01451 family)